MKKSATYEVKAVRIYMLLAAMVLALIFLVGVLWRIQVLRGSDYEKCLSRQSIRRVRLPGTRGCVFDRSGVCLAENRPSYCIAIYLEDLAQHVRPGDDLVNAVEAVIGDVAGVLRLKPEVSRKQIEDHIKRRSPLPLLAWRDVGKEAITRLIEGGNSFPGTDIYLQPVRLYPMGTLAAHILGNVGVADMKPDGDYHYYLPEITGCTGVEMTMDEFLRGEAGGLLIRVDARGFKYDLPGDQQFALEPRTGSDVWLTIDSRIQRLAEKAIEGHTGAVVVVDTRNGDILAMASAPTFDPNRFAMRMSTADWRKLSTDPGQPMLNRAASGEYSPGSIFKVVDVIAALEKGDGTTGSTVFQCPGYYQIGNRQLHCWNWRNGGHGLLSMEKAIEQSCNVYFCSLVIACGYDELYKTASTLGFGRKTGIDLGMEKDGNLPLPDSIRSKGHLANLSIGQGALLVTPIQIAMMTAAIANEGTVWHPRLLLGVRADGERDLRENPPRRERTIKWSRSTLSTLKNGMLATVHAENGTAKRARVAGLKIAGKTGTVEMGSDEDAPLQGWMVAFAPFEDPRYAVAIVMEHAVSGGITVAPRIGELMAGIFGKELEAQQTSEGANGGGE